MYARRDARGARRGLVRTVSARAWHHRMPSSALSRLGTAHGMWTLNERAHADRDVRGTCVKGCRGAMLARGEPWRRRARAACAHGGIAHDTRGALATMTGALGEGQRMRGGPGLVGVHPPARCVPKSASAGTAPQSGRLCAFGDAGDDVLHAAGMHTALWTANARRAPSGWCTTRGYVVLARTRRRMRTEMGNDAQGPLLVHQAHNSSELTRVGKRMKADIFWLALMVEFVWVMRRVVVVEESRHRFPSTRSSRHVFATSSTSPPHPPPPKATDSGNQPDVCLVYPLALVLGLSFAVSFLSFRILVNGTPKCRSAQEPSLWDGYPALPVDNDGKGTMMRGCARIGTAYLRRDAAYATRAEVTRGVRGGPVRTPYADPEGPCLVQVVCPLSSEQTAFVSLMPQWTPCGVRVPPESTQAVLSAGIVRRERARGRPRRDRHWRVISHPARGLVRRARRDAGPTPADPQIGAMRRRGEVLSASSFGDGEKCAARNFSRVGRYRLRSGNGGVRGRVLRVPLPRLARVARPAAVRIARGARLRGWAADVYACGWRDCVREGLRTPASRYGFALMRVKRGGFYIEGSGARRPVHADTSMMRSALDVGRGVVGESAQQKCARDSWPSPRRGGFAVRRDLWWAVVRGSGTAWDAGVVVISLPDPPTCAGVGRAAGDSHHPRPGGCGCDGFIAYSSRNINVTDFGSHRAP
ncbi:hypothetical protein C8R44DRAFT_906749 [Mycena epipterygia]|nr:hypothetical protein C8R44DRAFT_906749 [Mycena epipterygia]